jgi:hypothetical protein
VQQGGCEEKTVSQGKTRHTLRFDGTRYRIPKGLRSIDSETAG